MNIVITPKAQKHYTKLSKSEQAKVKKKITILQHEPFSGKKLGGELAELCSLMAWPYRIFYFISEKEHTIFITAILHRQGAYK